MDVKERKTDHGEDLDSTLYEMYQVYFISKVHKTMIFMNFWTIVQLSVYQPAYGYAIYSHESRTV